MTTAEVAIQPQSLRKARSFSERFDPAHKLTMAGAGVVILMVALLLFFIIANGIEIWTKSNFTLAQVFNMTWDPTSSETPSYGIIPFIAGTLGVMAVAAVIATPLSVGLAIFMAEVAPNWAKNIAQPAMEIFVGIPSVVYGWLGITILVPWLRENLNHLGFTLGFSWFAGSLVLSIMILPTITSITYDVLQTIPQDLRTASLALGTTRWQVIRHVLIPASLAGIATAVVLGMMRAAGEALAVQMVIGNTPVMPSALSKPVTTLTSQITLDMGNTVQGEPANQILWTMGLVLLVISFAFVVLVRFLARRRSIA
jgi:phosphate transport system permease protein